MSEPIFTLRSSIKPSLMRQAVIRGSLLSGTGGLLLLLTGIFLPLPLLKLWGFPIFLISIALITWGLWPYRCLKNIESNPNRIIIDENEWMHFSEKGKPIFSLPLNKISKINYMEQKNIYGIAFFLKDGDPQKNNQKDECDIFLAYFSKIAFNELEAHMTPESDHNPD